MLAETLTAPAAAAEEVRFVMQTWIRRTLVGIAAAAVVSLVAAAPDAQAQKTKSTQSEAKWIKFDPETKQVTVKVTKPGKGATPPKELKLKRGREASFKVIPTGSILTRTSVAINGRKGELADIPAGKTVNIYWIPDKDDKTARFARKIDVILSDEELDEMYGRGDDVD